MATNGADTVSDPIVCSAAQVFGDDTAGVTVNGSCTNDAGLQQAATPITLKIDRTAPTGVALSVIEGTAGANGWYTSDVKVRTSGSDATSGVTCTSDQTFTQESATIEVTGSCVNGAGLRTEAASISLKIDKSAPTASMAITSGTVGSNGWYRSAVTVTTSGADTVSNPVVCTAAQTFSSDTTGVQVSGSCTNDAGLGTNAQALTLKIDTAAPTGVTFSGGPTNGASYYFGSVPSAPTCTATDATSGLDSCVVSGHSTSVGQHTLTATARDNAGNEVEVTRTYTVLAWTIRGFYSPVDMDGSSRVVNTVKAGSTVPLKFEVFAGSTELTSTSAVVQPLTLLSTGCSAGSTEDPIEITASGSTVLRYDATAGQFIFNWKTPAQVGCYDVAVKTQDGSAIVAHFRLR